MGTKLIITESEKNFIKSLYELKSSSESVPPSESILVAKKNPYKYSEYESARRLYSADLKDGDMFYYFNSSAYNEKLEKELVSKYYRKTMRIGDEIFTMFPEVYPTGVVVGFRKNPNSAFDDFSLIAYPNESDVRVMSKSEAYREEIKNSVKPYLTNLIASLQNSYKDLLEKQKTSTYNVDQLPDEFFEIRKVERMKTDF